MRVGEERTGHVRRTTNADQYRRRWLDRTPTIDISRLGWPDRIHLACNRRCVSRSRQHISTRTLENSERKRNRHWRRYTGGACEQLAPFSLQSGGRIPERHARNTIVEHLPVSLIRRDLIELRRRGEKDSTHQPTVVQGHGRAHGVNAGNLGMVERGRYLEESRVVDMMGRLHVDLFLQDIFLLNGVDVKIRLVRSKDAFSLMADGQNPDYKVRIVEATLFARKAVLSPTVQMAHIKALAKGAAKYPLRPVDCKVYSIPQGAMSHTHENLFLGTLPKRLSSERLSCIRLGWKT